MTFGAVCVDCVVTREGQRHEDNTQTSIDSAAQSAAAVKLDVTAVDTIEPLAGDNCSTQHAAAPAGAGGGGGGRPGHGRPLHRHHRRPHRGRHTGTALYCTVLYCTVMCVTIQGSCTDNRGQLIQEGRLFEPGPDECQVSTCVLVTRVLVKRVLVTCVFVTSSPETRGPVIRVS